MIDTGNLQRWRDRARAGIKIILISNLGQTNRTFPLDHCAPNYRIIELRRCARIASRIGRRGGESIGASRKWAGRIAPCTTGVRGRRPECCCTIENCHFAVGFRRAR